MSVAEPVSSEMDTGLGTDAAVVSTDLEYSSSSPSKAAPKTRRGFVAPRACLGSTTKAAVPAPEPPSVLYTHAKSRKQAVAQAQPPQEQAKRPTHKSAAGEGCSKKKGCCTKDYDKYSHQLKVTSGGQEDSDEVPTPPVLRDRGCDYDPKEQIPEREAVITHPLTHSETHILSHTLTHTRTYSHTHILSSVILTHSHTHSLMYSLTHSLTH